MFALPFVFVVGPDGVPAICPPWPYHWHWPVPYPWPFPGDPRVAAPLNLSVEQRERATKLQAEIIERHGELAKILATAALPALAPTKG